jgi:hypothetical protein
MSVMAKEFAIMWHNPKCAAARLYPNILQQKNESEHTQTQPEQNLQKHYCMHSLCQQEGICIMHFCHNIRPLDDCVRVFGRCHIQRTHGKTIVRYLFSGHVENGIRKHILKDIFLVYLGEPLDSIAKVLRKG